MDKTRQQIVKASQVMADNESSARESRDKFALTCQQEVQLSMQKGLARYAFPSNSAGLEHGHIYNFPQTRKYEGF